MPPLNGVFLVKISFAMNLPNYLVLGNMSLQRIFTLGIEGHFCRRKQNLAAISNCKIVKLCRVV